MKLIKNVSENKQHDKYDEVSKRFYPIVSEIVRDIKRMEHNFFFLLGAFALFAKDSYYLPLRLSAHMHTFINSAPTDGPS